MFNFLKSRKPKVQPKKVRPPTPPLPSIDVKDVNGKPRKLQFVPCLSASFEQLRGDGTNFRTLEVTRYHSTVDCDNILCYLEFVNPKGPAEEGSKLKFHPKYTGRMILRRIEHVYHSHPAIAKGFVVLYLDLANVCDEDMERVNQHKDRIVKGFNEECREDYFPNIF